MKAIRTVAVAVILAATALTASAQRSMGVIAGVEFSDLKIGGEKLVATSGVDLYHAGFTLRQNLGKGFSLQPSILYQRKGFDFKNGEGEDASARLGYLNVPIAVSWGPNLLAFRPFIEAVPFFGIGLDGKLTKGGDSLSDVWKSMIFNRFEVGAGLGGGIEIWIFQLSARYKWTFNKLQKPETNNVGGWAESLKDCVKDAQFSGVTVSLAVLF